ncbi:MAG: thrombospondin type 3 repeat-containing protein [Patescibacteria group bacterium]
MDREHKLTYGAITVMGVFALALGLLRLGNAVSGPFERKGTRPPSVEETARLAREALRGKDTDQDGLSDYDETFLYRTSPYIEDTDSDGFSDSQEVESGNDPNCPQGRDCGSGALSSSEGAGSVAPQPTIAPPSDDLQASLQAGITPNPQALRDALRSAGIPTETLDKIPDNELMKLYEETLKGFAASGTQR